MNDYRPLSLKFALAALGFSSTIAQVLLMRELVATLYGNELLFGLVLVAWLAWVAMGAWILPRYIRISASERGGLAWGLVLMGVLILVQLMVTRGLRDLLDVVPGTLVEFSTMVGAVFLILAPLCLLGGFLFSLGARAMIKEGSSASQAYVWESLGSVAGGALFSFVLLYWLDVFQSAFLIIVVILAVFTDLWVLPHLPPSRFVRWLQPVGMLLLFIVLLPVAKRVHQATLRWQWDGLIFAEDSPYGRLTIQARQGQIAFFENGLLAFETQGTFAEEITHLPLLAHPDPHQVLLIGGGVAGDLREALKHSISQITYVELDPLVIQVAKKYLPPQEAAVFDDPRVKIDMMDGRLFVKRAASASMDVVILDLPEPATGSLNRFYTREFFAEVRRLLKPGGVFALALPSAENYLSPELVRRNASVFHTLLLIFPQVLVLPGENHIFLASDIPLANDPVVWANRFSERFIDTRWVTPQYITYLLTTDRFEQVRNELEKASGFRLNEDLRPICYFYHLTLWLSRFYPGLHRVFAAVGGGEPSATSPWRLGWIVLLLLLLVFLARWQKNMRIPLVVAGIGLAQMSLEMVILFAFQVLQGYVYAEVSLVITAFMAGLALGSMASSRLLSSSRWGNARKALLIDQALIAVFSVALPLIFKAPVLSPRLSFPLFAMLAGALAGIAFPLSLALCAGSPGRAAGTLYAADLIGGCVGALVSTLLLIPLLGIPQTCAIIALIGLAGMLVVLG